MVKEGERGLLAPTDHRLTVVSASGVCHWRSVGAGPTRSDASLNNMVLQDSGNWHG